MGMILCCCRCYGEGISALLIYVKFIEGADRYSVLKNNYYDNDVAVLTNQVRKGNVLLASYEFIIKTDASLDR